MKRRVAAGLCFALILSIGSAWATDGKIRVVASANQYGDLVDQIGGAAVSVVSLLSNPNVDPHEYESNVSDAQKVAEADLVVVNGGGYDDWFDKLLSVTPRAKRSVIRAFDVAVTKIEGNEHVWYDPNNALAVSQKILEVLKRLRPDQAASFDTRFKILKDNILRVRDRLEAMKTRFAGTKIALTETIFLYQTRLMDLKVLTPEAYQKAVAEDQDPAPFDVLLAERQVKEKSVKVLIFNRQTTTPITNKLLALAKTAAIPTVGVAENLPSGKNYQSWMLDQLQQLEAALTSPAIPTK